VQLGGRARVVRPAGWVASLKKIMHVHQRRVEIRRVNPARIPIDWRRATASPPSQEACTTQ
jgi:hypothetical protein